MPTLEQYESVLTHPDSAFADTELRGCAPMLDRHGRPFAVAGKFGSVFRFDHPAGYPLAVKCFTHYAEHPGLHQRRHALISSVLSRLSRRWKVDFDVLPKGVLVGCDWHPILKMQWVEGKSLGSFIDGSLRRPGVLATVARRFASLVADLAEEGLAHGDLHQGNILVEPDMELRLVDYGGMYVPELEPLGVPEKGHKDFQSPDREGQFGPDVDRFSAWVIYGSLVALTIDPTLWFRLRAGRSDQLLFNHADFRDPAGSGALRVLQETGKGALQALAETLRSVWEAGLAQIPKLDPGALPPPAPASA
ncbi:MAG TPA: AarF/UbiB family protein [Actinomycetota bacterium]|jgi:hypothetical protein